MGTKLELITQQALSQFPTAAEKAASAAKESLEAAKKERVRVRRQRIVSTSSMQAVTTSLAPPEPAATQEAAEALEVPEDWRDDEDTKKITLPEK